MPLTWIPIYISMFVLVVIILCRSTIDVWWLPELRYIEDSTDRRAVSRRVKKHTNRMPKVWAVSSLIVLPTLLGWQGVIDNIFMFWLVVLCVLVVAWHIRQLQRRWLRRELADMSMCPNCGYDLTGNVTGVCSECGTAIADATGRHSGVYTSDVKP